MTQIHKYCKHHVILYIQRPAEPYGKYALLPRYHARATAGTGEGNCRPAKRASEGEGQTIEQSEGESSTTCSRLCSQSSEDSQAWCRGCFLAGAYKHAACSKGDKPSSLLLPSLSSQTNEADQRWALEPFVLQAPALVIIGIPITASWK